MLILVFYMKTVSISISHCTTHCTKVGALTRQACFLRASTTLSSLLLSHKVTLINVRQNH